MNYAFIVKNCKCPLRGGEWKGKKSTMYHQIYIVSHCSFWSKNNFWSIGCVFEQWNHFLNLIVILKEENLIFRKTTVFYIKMSCLYADMILDLRKNSMNEVEKRFIDEKLKTEKTLFVQKRNFFLRSILILKTLFDLIFTFSGDFWRIWMISNWSKINLRNLETS